MAAIIRLGSPQTGVEDGKRWLFVLLTIACLAQLFLALFFLPQYPGFDDRTLFAAVYSYLHYDRMMYPIYDAPFMYIHTPTKYFLVAWLNRLGLSIRLACAFLILVSYAMFLAGIWYIRASFVVRSALLLALTFAMTLPQYLAYRYEFYSHGELLGGLRPDVLILVSWIAGLVWLEAARQRSWSPWLLTIGSLLICYAATLHYWAFPCAAALVVYAAAIMLDKQRSSSFLMAIAPLFAGPIAILLPFVVVMLPYASTAASLVTTQVGHSASLTDAGRRHITDLTFFVSLMKEYFPVAWPVEALVSPAMLLGVPLWTTASLIVVWIKEARWLAGAMVSLPLMIQLVNHKSTGYYLPEICFFLFCVLMLLGLLAKYSPKLAQGYQWFCLLATLTFGPAFWEPSKLRYPKFTAQEDVLRAASREIVGPNATVVGPFYTSGESNWVHNANAFSPGVDFRVEQEWDFDTATLHEAFSAKFVNLAGFLFTPETPSSSMLYFTQRTAKPLVGYVYRSERLHRFQAGGKGWVFQVHKCKTTSEERLWALKTVPQIAMYLPQTNYCLARAIAASIAGDQTSSAFMRTVSLQDGVSDEAIVPSLVREDMRPAIESRLRDQCSCQLEEAVEGTLEPVDQVSLAEGLSSSDRRIRFFINAADLAADRSMDELFFGAEKRQ